MSDSPKLPFATVGIGSIRDLHQQFEDANSISVPLPDFQQPASDMALLRPQRARRLGWLRLRRYSRPIVRPHGNVMTGRYEVFDPEAEFEPGSRGRALRNRLGITSVRALQQRESEALLATTQQVIDQVTVDQKFTADDVRRLHHLWLGEIYEWAGEYRSVNIAKGEFMFAAAAQVPRLMQQLEQGPLRLYTPCRI